MRGRQLLIILGAVAVLLIAAIVGIAIYMIHGIEQKYNSLKTAPAREKRWPDNNQAKGGEQQQAQQEQQPHEQNAQSGEGGSGT